MNAEKQKSIWNCVHYHCHLSWFFINSRFFHVFLPFLVRFLVFYFSAHLQSLLFHLRHSSRKSVQSLSSYERYINVFLYIKPFIFYVRLFGVNLFVVFADVSLPQWARRKTIKSSFQSNPGPTVLGGFRTTRLSDSSHDNVLPCQRWRHGNLLSEKFSSVRHGIRTRDTWTVNPVSRPPCYRGLESARIQILFTFILI